MAYCCICNKPITGVPALVAYPDNAPTFHYCTECAAGIYADACVGKYLRTMDEKLYNRLHESTRIIGMCMAAMDGAIGDAND